MPQTRIVNASDHSVLPGPQRRPVLTIALSAALAVYVTCLCYGTHTPLAYLPITIHNDVLYHFVAYFVLTSIVFLVLHERASRTRVNSLGQVFKTCCVAWAVACGFAVVDELTQPLFGRNFQWRDIAADFSGAALAVMTMAVAAQFVTLLGRRRRVDLAKRARVDLAKRARVDLAKRTKDGGAAARPRVQ